MFETKYYDLQNIYETSKKTNFVKYVSCVTLANGPLEFGFDLNLRVIFETGTVCLKNSDNQ